MPRSIRKALGVRTVKAAKAAASSSRTKGGIRLRQNSPSASSTHVNTVLKQLSDEDEVLSDVIKVVGPPTSLTSRWTDQAGDAFLSLVKSITSQQLSGKAAATIFSRVEAGCNGRITPLSIINTDKEVLRSMGLSYRKAEYLKDLAGKFQSGELTDQKLRSSSTEEVMASLLKVKGLGEWSVHMFQIFHLGCENVLPVGDLAVKKGAAALYCKGKKIVTPKELEQIANKWDPYKSYGSWYMANKYLELKRSSEDT